MAVALRSSPDRLLLLLLRQLLLLQRLLLLERIEYAQVSSVLLGCASLLR